MTPYFRYVVITLLALAAAIGVTKARADDGEVNMTCVTQLMGDVARVVSMHEAGAPYKLTRHLILTDPDNRDSARWLLVQVLDGLDGGYLAPERAHTFLWELCYVPMSKMPGLDSAIGQELINGLTNMGRSMFFPIQDEFKDI